MFPQNAARATPRSFFLAIDNDETRPSVVVYSLRLHGLGGVYLSLGGRAAAVSANRTERQAAEGDEREQMREGRFPVCYKCKRNRDVTIFTLRILLADPTHSAHSSHPTHLSQSSHLSESFGGPTDGKWPVARSPHGRKDGVPVTATQATVVDQDDMIAKPSRDLCHRRISRRKRQNSELCRPHGGSLWSRRHKTHGGQISSDAEGVTILS